MKCCLNLDEPQQHEGSDQGWQILENKIPAIAEPAVVPQPKPLTSVRVEGCKEECTQHDEAKGDEECQPHGAKDSGKEVELSV